MKRLVIVVIMLSLIFVPSVQAQDRTVEFFESMSPDEMLEPGTPTTIGYKARWYGTEDIITANLSVFIVGYVLLQYDNTTDFWITEVVRNSTGDYQFGVVEVFHPEAINFLQTTANITIRWGTADDGQNYLGTLEFGGLLGFLSVIGAIVFFANRSKDED